MPTRFVLGFEAGPGDGSAVLASALESEVGRQLGSLTYFWDGSSEGTFGDSPSTVTSLGEATPENPLPGDHDGDGSVDARDYVAWRLDPDRHGGGEGYQLWREHFGRVGR